MTLLMKLLANVFMVYQKGAKPTDLTAGSISNAVPPSTEPGGMCHQESEHLSRLYTPISSVHGQHHMECLKWMNKQIIILQWGLHTMIL